jgi:DNA-binding transcriptional ArsR family regulator
MMDVTRMPEGGRRRELPLPPEELVIRDAGQLKALGDALRLRILEVMGRRLRHGWSVKELAEALGSSQTKLYHHVNLLEDRKLLRVAGTQVVSGIVERRYQLTARSFRLDRSLVSGADAGPAVGQLLDAAVGETRRQIMDGIARGVIDPSDQTPGRRLLLFRNRLRLQPERVAAFAERLQALMDEEDAGEEPGAVEHGLLIAFYPVTTDEGPGT